ncbi:MAG: insulinase family protein [Bacilli bacterium]|nr:insulinase family protein [Bacilli bacterium]
MEEIKIKGLNETIYYELSTCGLPIYMWKNTKKSSYYLSLGVKYGSLHTDYKLNGKTIHDPKGIAHYLEHLKFNEKDGTSANDFFERNGTSANAFTTFEYTNYEVIGTEFFEENLNHLLDFVYTPYFTSKLVNKERGIITEEIKMGMDNPYNKLYFEFFKNVFHKYNYQYEVAGTVEDIKDITVNQIENAFKTFYHPENMFLIITGNFNPYEAIEIVNKNLSNKEFGKFKKIEMLDQKESSTVCEKEKVLYENVEIPKIKLGLKLKKSLFKDIDDISLYIAFSILLRTNFGGSSEFQEFLIANRLVEYIRTQREIYNDYIVISITFESKCPEETIKIITKKLKNMEIDAGCLERRCKANIANLVLDFDNVTAINNMIQSNLIQYEKIIDNMKEIYENFELETLNTILKKIKIDKSNLTILKLLPKED